MRQSEDESDDIPVHCLILMMFWGPLKNAAQNSHSLIDSFPSGQVWNHLPHSHKRGLEVLEVGYTGSQKEGARWDFFVCVLLDDGKLFYQLTKLALVFKASYFQISGFTAFVLVAICCFPSWSLSHLSDIVSQGSESLLCRHSSVTLTTWCVVIQSF